MKNHAHGQVKVSVDGHIMTVSYYGQFNLEGISQGIAKQRKIIESFKGAPFAVLVDDKNIQGGTPESYQALEHFNQWVNTQFLVAKAMIFQSKLQLKILDSLVEARSEQNIRSFSNKDDALNWLKEELSKANQTDHRA